MKRRVGPWCDRRIGAPAAPLVARRAARRPRSSWRPDRSSRALTATHVYASGARHVTSAVSHAGPCAGGAASAGIAMIEAFPHPPSGGAFVPSARYDAPATCLCHGRRRPRDAELRRDRPGVLVQTDAPEPIVLGYTNPPWAQLSSQEAPASSGRRCCPRSSPPDTRSGRPRETSRAARRFLRHTRTWRRLRMG